MKKTTYKKKTILFLGVSKVQQKSIFAAKKYGFKIIGVDKNNNSFCRKYCDKFINTNCNNSNYITNKILKLKKYNVIDIWANNDVLLKSKYKIEKKLNILPDISFLKILKLTKKNRFKNFFKKYLIKNTQNKYPLIAKPIDGSGSSGIKILYNRREFNNLNLKRNYIFEEYIENFKEYGVNFYFDKKKIFILNSVYRYFDHKVTLAPLGTVALKSNKSILKYLYQIKKMILRLKIYGKLKFDIGIHNNKLKIIEASPRFHGEIDTAHLFSYNNNSIPDFYFGKKNGNHSKHKINNSSFYGYFACYKKINNLKKIKNLLKKENIIFLKIIKRDNFIYKKLSAKDLSTNNIYSYIFYKVDKKIADTKFKKISHQINCFVG